MKFNKLYLTLGVAGLALVSCSEDLEYTPAPAVDTPPVYFSMTDESLIDLEEDSKMFTIPVYRQNTAAAGTASVKVALSTSDGTNANNLFKLGVLETVAADQALTEGQELVSTDEASETKVIFNPSGAGFGADGNADMTVNFAAGSGETDIVAWFGSVSNLTQMVNYYFKVSTPGESSPYYITNVDYSVSFTPWENITEGPVILKDFAFLAPSTAGREIQFEVNCQKHPIRKDFFRLIRPYENCGYGTYVLPLTDPNYLYLNAANPSEVYFSDKDGGYQLMYDTGVDFFQMSEGVSAGTVRLGCKYCYNKTETDLVLGGNTIYTYDELTGAGSYNKGRISFGTSLLVMLSEFTEGAWSSKSWTLEFPWAPSEWQSLGEGTYTDGFIGQYFNFPVETYPVTVESNTETAGLYRLVAPYAYGVWPSQIAVPWDEQYNMVIDASDKNFVTIEEQLVFDDGETNVIASNAGFFYTNYVFNNNGNQVTFTKEDIIEEGLNDVMEDGVITIAHPIIQENGGEQILLWEPKKWHWDTPAKLVLPVEEPAAAPAKVKAVSNKIDRSTIVKKH